MKTKPNLPHFWKVALCPATTSKGPMHRPKLFEFVGEIQGVLNFADEMESGVDFEVQQFIITRGRRKN